MLDGREAVLAATGHHPYARFAAGMAAKVTGRRGRDAVLWFGDTIHGPTGHGLGEPSTLDELLAGAPEAGRVNWINLPRRDEPPAGFARRDEWDFRWIDRPVDRVPGQDLVVRLDPGADDAVNRLLDLAMPDTVVRPGRSHVLAWYGVWIGGELAACGADRSTRPADPAAEPVGVLGGIAVHPGHRRRGLGAAVSAELTRLLQADHALVTLGVAAGNEPASRVYHRLGYTQLYQVSAVHMRH